MVYWLLRASMQDFYDGSNLEIWNFKIGFVRPEQPNPLEIMGSVANLGYLPSTFENKGFATKTSGIISATHAKPGQDGSTSPQKGLESHTTMALRRYICGYSL